MPCGVAGNFLLSAFIMVYEFLVCASVAGSTIMQQWSAALISLLCRLDCFTGFWKPVPIRPPAVPNEELLPGLPNSLVLDCILPRIPWHARPLLKATNRAWNFALDGLSTSDYARTLSRQFNKKDGDDGPYPSDGRLVRLKHLCDRRYIISLYDSAQEIWRNLPPLPRGSLPSMPMVTGFLGTRELKNGIQVDYVCGKVVAAAIYATSKDECRACVWILDVDGGMWKWEEQHSIPSKTQVYRPGFPLVGSMAVLGGKLYMLRHGVYDWNKPIVYDLATEKWGKLPLPIFPEVGSRSPYNMFMEGLYSLEVHRDPDTGKFIKSMYAQGPYTCMKVLDPLTATWKHFCD